MNRFFVHTSDGVPYLLLLLCLLNLSLSHLFIDLARIELSRSLLYIRRVAMFRKSVCGLICLHSSLARIARQPAGPRALIVVPLGIGIELRIILVDCQEGLQHVTQSGFISPLLHLINKLISLLDESLADFIFGRCWLCDFCISYSSFPPILNVFSGMFSQVERQYFQLCLLLGSR